MNSGTKCNYARVTHKGHEQQFGEEPSKGYAGHWLYHASPKKRSPDFPKPCKAHSDLVHLAKCGRPVPEEPFEQNLDLGSSGE